jgi:hypothetical protein
VSRSNRLSLSIAGTAAVALASLPLAVSPAGAAKVSEGTTSSIGVMEDASNAQQFNLRSLGVQGSSIGLVAQVTSITQFSNFSEYVRLLYSYLEDAIKEDVAKEDVAKKRFRKNR